MRNYRGMVWGIDKAYAKARAFAVSKELMTAEKPEKEEGYSYGTDEDCEIH